MRSTSLPSSLLGDFHSSSSSSFACDITPPPRVATGTQICVLWISESWLSVAWNFGRRATLFVYFDNFDCMKRNVCIIMCVCLFRLAEFCPVTTVSDPARRPIGVLRGTWRRALRVSVVNALECG